jgi:hypothetical protein
MAQDAEHAALLVQRIAVNIILGGKRLGLVHGGRPLLSLGFGSGSVAAGYQNS